MSLRFRYRTLRSADPVVTLGGRLSRPRPLVTISLTGPSATWPIEALVDTGADDTVFPERVATIIGVDLTNAPAILASGFGHGTAVVRYAEVALRIADNHERREWRAWVGFSASMPRYPMLGYAGFLQFFTATFHGDREEVELSVNGSYSGT